MFSSADLEVVQVPGYGKPKVVRARVRVDKMCLHSASDYKMVLGMAAEQAKDMICKNIGTARGEYSFLCQNDESLFSLGRYLLVTATWTSQCRSIKAPKPPLKPEDILGE